MDPVGQIERRTPAAQLANPSDPLTSALPITLSNAGHAQADADSDTEGVWVLR